MQPPQFTRRCRPGSPEGKAICEPVSYNEAVKQVTEEELLLNLVRLRYNDDFIHLDMSSVTAQYELDAAAEARPFFGFASSVGLGFFRSVVLPDAAVTTVNRPTLTMVPLNDPATVRRLFRPGTVEEILFLAETSWPIATICRLYVESLNGVPNAPSASGPTRAFVPQFREFQRVVELLQVLQDSAEITLVHADKHEPGQDEGATRPEPEKPTSPPFHSAIPQGKR
jgi:hypothetical protein